MPIDSTLVVWWSSRPTFTFLEVCVNGSALVTRDAEELLVRENESIYLPLGCVHRLENPGRIPLTLIEVQSGSYLGEDDIVRIEDTYGRS